MSTEIEVHPFRKEALQESDTDRWTRLGEDARQMRSIPHHIADELMCALDSAVDLIRVHDRAIAEMTDPQREQLELAELRVQLAKMTAREKMWRSAHMDRIGEQSRAVVSGFSDFCEGHKAGMRQR